MQTRPLGRSGLQPTVITMGGWQAGKDQWTNVDDEGSIAAIRAAYDAGIRSFDTAEAYGAGHGEEILGRALEGRDDVVLMSKVFPHHYAPADLRESCETSLRRLRVECLDLYQLHWPPGVWGTPVHPLQPAIEMMLQLQTEGKIKALGVSNFNTALLEETLGYGRIESLQPPYSLFWRHYERDGTLDTCRRHDLGVLAYSPLAQGLLTGKFNHGNRPGEGDNRAGNALFQDPVFDKALAAVDQLRPMAEKYGISMSQLALAWVLHQPGMTSVIAGARTAAQARDNAHAAEVQLEAADVAAIDRIGRAVSDTLPLEQTNMWGG